MRRLLALFLICLMFSTAGAAIEISIDGATNGANGTTNPMSIMTLSIGTVTIGIYNDDGGDYFSYLDIYDASETPGGPFGILSGASLTSIAGDLSQFKSFDYYPDWEYEVVLAQSVGSSTPGIQFEVDCQHDFGDYGKIVIELWDSSYTQILDKAVVYYPGPEPMTFALMCLGGLFLRRRSEQVSKACGRFFLLFNKNPNRA